MNPDAFRFLYILALLLAALVAATVARVAWRRRHAPGALPLSVLLWAQTWWSVCFALQLSSAPRPEPLFWFKLMFVGVVVIPAAFLLFALQYTGNTRALTRRNLLLLAVEPLLLHLAIWTDPQHGLFIGGYVPGSEARFGGPAFWLHSLYSYVLTFAAFGLIGWRYVRGPAIYRQQALVMLASAVAVLAANAITLLRLVPSDFDFTPIGFTVAGVVTTYALFRYRLLDLVPVAREAVVERMTDGVLVLDAEGRVLDVNRAAEALLHLEARAVVGQPARKALAAWPEIGESCETGTDLDAKVLLDREGRHIDLRVTALDGRHRAGTRLVVMRDVSHVKRIESELRDANERLRQKLTEIESLQARLKEQSIRDPLTGLYNRRFLEESLARELAQARRLQTPLSVAMIDLDRFKHVNDVHGHHTGDAVLVSLGELLRAQARSGDVACRYGGEEFVVVMPGAPLETALQRVDDWRRRFAALETVTDGARMRCTFSAGVACFPVHGVSPEALLNAADHALYAAKDAGRDRVVAATTTPLPLKTKS